MTADSIEIALVAAVAENGVIGRDGDLPWYYPEDLRRFKETTMGHPVIVGRTTFEGILDRLGEPLPGRTNVVLTEGELAREDVAIVDSIDGAIEAARATGSDVAYVIGGASVYEQFIDRADRLILTEIRESYEGDAYFPEIGREWREVDRESREAFDFVEYERRDGGSPNRR